MSANTPSPAADLERIEAYLQGVTLQWLPGYIVRPDGTIWSCTNWRGIGLRMLVPNPNKYGYLKVRCVLPNGKRKGIYVHKLVAEAFLEKPDGCTQLRHLNGNRIDNRAENLRWGTAKENADDRESHGTTARDAHHGMHTRPESRRYGERTNLAKLTADQVTEIRKLRSNGAKCKDLAVQYGVRIETISSIVNGRTWKC